MAVARSEIEVGRAQIADARAQLQFEETMLQHRTLAAPYDALVIERHKEPGSVVKAGDPIFTLIAADTVWGLAFIDEARAGFIQEGQKVDARLRSRPLDVFTGEVVRIGLESDRVSEERRVYIKGDNPPPRVHLGEQAEFWITVAKLDAALLVPEAAVHGYDGRQGTVWTIENGRLQRRIVDFRHRTEDARLELVSGLPDKAQVVIVDPAGLQGRSGGARRGGASEMNLAYRDIRHNLFRFLLTCVGLGLLLGVVLAMIGIYRGLVVDALTIARSPAVDLWVVEANTRGPFAEASRIPGDTREAIARLSGVAAAGSVTYQTVETEHRGKQAAPLCHRL